MSEEALNRLRREIDDLEWEIADLEEENSGLRLENKNLQGLSDFFYMAYFQTMRIRETHKGIIHSDLETELDKLLDILSEAQIDQ